MSDHRDLGDLRQNYERGELHESDLAATWPDQFDKWWTEAKAAPVIEPNAMILATADEDRLPSARTVLLKGRDERGFVFYTNLRSRKGRDIAVNPSAALVFPWLWLERQVVVAGDVEPIDPDVADDYFDRRPAGSRIGAVISPQGEVIGSRAVLDEAKRELEAECAAGTPLVRPEHWGGLRVVPRVVEFWQGRPDRLHDRLRYRRDPSGAWLIERLAP